MSFDKLQISAFQKTCKGELPLSHELLFQVLGQNVDLDLLGGLNTDVAVRAQNWALDQSRNNFLDFRVIDGAELLSRTFDEFSALIRGGKVRLDRRENTLAAHQNHIAQYKSAHIARPAALLLAVKTSDSIGDFGFKSTFAEGFHLRNGFKLSHLIESVSFQGFAASLLCQVLPATAFSQNEFVELSKRDYLTFADSARHQKARKRD